MLIKLQLVMKLLVTQLFIIVLAERTPQIVKITEDQYRSIGGAVELSCSVLYYSENQNSVLWKKQDGDKKDYTLITTDTTNINSDTRYTIRYDSSSTTYTLNIKDIQQQDAGMYVCEIIYSSSNRVSKEVQLLVYSPPLISENTSTAIVVNVNSPVQLECYADGVPRPHISWKRENNALLPTGGTSYRGNILKINSIKKDDRGTYYCTAANQVGSKKRSYIIEVEFPPSFSYFTKEVKQALNYDAELSCRVEAFPAPIIYWYDKDGFQLSDNGHYNIFQGKTFGEYTESILRVKTVENFQYGVYTCKALNKLGYKEQTLFLYESSTAICPPACGSSYYNAALSILPAMKIIMAAITINNVYSQIFI